MRAQFKVIVNVPSLEVLPQIITNLSSVLYVTEVVDELEKLPPQAVALLQVLSSRGPITSAAAGEHAHIQRHTARALLSECVAVGAAERLEQGTARGRARRATVFVITDRGQHLAEKSQH